MVNTVASWPTLEQAKARVLEIQIKLHQWSKNDSSRSFDDLFNLVCDPAFLTVAWSRMRGNKGARSSGIDGQTAAAIENGRGTNVFLAELRADLKARTFAPLPVRERMIPKANGKRRRLGIPTVRDRVVQGSLKLVMEPIFEADFQPCSHGFRPKHRAQDAIADIHLLTSQTYEWVLEADIEACFDRIDHVALMDRIRARIADKRVLALVKAFLKAGLLTEAGQPEQTITGTPQGGILSPLLANIALSVLDDHFVEAWQTLMGTNYQRAKRRKANQPNYRLIRYADDFVVVVSGTKADAEALRNEVAATLLPMGLVLSEPKTRVIHIDEGFDFLGFRIQRKNKRGTVKQCVYTYPSKSAVAEIKAKVRRLTKGTTNRSLSSLLGQLSMTLRGWANYFRHACSSATFAYLDSFIWWRVWLWVRRKHPRRRWKELRRLYYDQWRPTHEGVTLLTMRSIGTSRYRFRGTTIATPWAT